MISENLCNGRPHLYGRPLSAQGKSTADANDAPDEFYKEDTPGTECKKSFQIPLQVGDSAAARIRCKFQSNKHNDRDGYPKE